MRLAINIESHFLRCEPQVFATYQKLIAARAIGNRDGIGQEREHKTQVMQDFWVNHTEGGRIAVVYSKSKPSISGVKYQVEQKRTALAKRVVEWIRWRVCALHGRQPIGR